MTEIPMMIKRVILFFKLPLCSFMTGIITQRVEKRKENGQEKGQNFQLRACGRTRAMHASSVLGRCRYILQRFFLHLGKLVGMFTEHPRLRYIPGKDTCIQGKDLRAENGAVDMPDGDNEKDHEGLIRMEDLGRGDDLPRQKLCHDCGKPEDDTGKHHQEHAGENAPVFKLLLVCVSAAPCGGVL